MRPTTLTSLLKYFSWPHPLGVTQLSQRTGLSRTILHKYVKALVAQWDLKKVGTWAHTKYELTAPTSGTDHIYEPPATYTTPGMFSLDDQQLLDRVFLKFTPRGTRLKWVEGFAERCGKRHLDPVKKIVDYRDIYVYLESIRTPCKLLDATQAFVAHVDTPALDRILYADQYKWMDFGRWALAELTFYAKQSQSRQLIRESIGIYEKQLRCHISEWGYDALAFVPWSVTRQVQLLAMMDAALYDIDLPRVTLKKYYEWSIKVPQKSLKKREERIENARETIYVRDEYIWTYKNVLLIDDFVWSGSTLNETAKKLKKSGVQNVTGFAIVWNMDLSYEVIREM